MHLNEFGTITRDEWDKSFSIRRELLPDEFMVMPIIFTVLCGWLIGVVIRVFPLIPPSL